MTGVDGEEGKALVILVWGDVGKAESVDLWEGVMRKHAVLHKWYLPDAEPLSVVTYNVILCSGQGCMYYEVTTYIHTYIYCTMSLVMSVVARCIQIAGLHRLLHRRA